MVLSLAACGGNTADEVVTTTGPGGAVSTSEDVSGEGCANVVAASIEWVGATATVSATVRSADTGWDKYADRWEVRADDGTVLGERILTHPHETEQPFTRSLTGVEIPGDVARVVIAAHDSVAGWCGETFAVDVPAAP